MSDKIDWVFPSLTQTRNDSLGTDRSEVKPAIYKEFLDVEQVRIYPGKLVFGGAYDGKQFVEKFTIINFKKVPVFVRVMLPTSSAFKMKPLPKGRILSTGLSITRYIRYTYSSAIALPQVFISIYIDEKPILYELEVYYYSNVTNPIISKDFLSNINPLKRITDTKCDLTNKGCLSEAVVKMNPKMLHFGEIDVGTASEQLSLHLHNEGLKITHFAVDLGRNDLELIVDPMKGSIQPSETVEIKVEILGSRVGNFLKEFWIKTEPPQRIWLTGTFILPKLKIEHPPSNFELIVLDFPKTYYNADSIRTLIITNSSSINTMFCTMANYKNEEIKLDEARKSDHNLKFFIFSPKEGRLTKNHKAAIIVRFAPRRLRTFTQKYCIAMIKILKVNYRDGIIKGKDIEVKTFSSNLEADQFQIGSVCSVEEGFTEFEFRSSYLRICLYGEIEEAGVKLTPHSIDRDDLNIGQMYNFTFNVRNCSKYLPITFKYEKLACFEMEPPQMTLKPNSSVDVLLLLAPSTIGEINKKICLHLTHKSNGIVYQVGSAYFSVRYLCHNNREKVSPMLKPRFNMGITPALTHEVGFLTEDFRYNQAKEAPMQAFVDNKKMMSFSARNKNLIAFPNDRPKTLRPWTNTTPCLTIFANLPRAHARDYKYALTSSETCLKTKNKQKYIDLLRKKRKETTDDDFILQENTAYPTTIDKVLMTNEPVRDCPYIFPDSTKNPEFIPLTPEQLMGIEITPHYIQLGKIAPYISCSDFFSIENKNEFPIVINIVALSNSVIVKGKKRITIAAFENAKLYFDCFSHGLGKYYVPVYIIINDCHIFDATVFAEVVPTTVKCKSKEITINPKDNVGYLELFNPVNCAIDFSWSLQDKNYSIMPPSGTIESRRSLYCKIVFTPRVEAVFKIDIYLFSQSGAKQVVTVCNENKKANILTNTPLVEFHDIPLNMMVSENLVFKNNSATTIVLYIKEQQPMKEINIFPKEAILPGRSTMFFEVFANFKTVEKFKCSCQFVVQDQYEQQIEIIGQVNYPTFTVEPTFIQIQKIITGACQRKVFRLKNTNTSKLSIKFVLDLYPDYKVTDMDKHILNEITLDPKESVNLYLEFQPLEPTAYTFYVPLVLNGLVGPPLLNNPKSFEYKTYFDRLPSTEQSEHTVMPGLRVSCAAGAAWFRFSSLYLNFTNEVLENELHVANISSVTRNMKLYITNLDPCFSVEVTSGTYKTKQHYIKVTLEPEQEAVFLFKFDSEIYGTFESEIPFFVVDYFENCPFNFVRLHAVGTKATIDSKIKIICLPTIPVKTICTKAVSVTLLSHKLRCKVTAVCDDESLKAELRKRKSEDGNTQQIRVVFIPKKECNVTSKITIKCTCEASYEIAVVASANNCSLLSFRHRMKCCYTRKSIFKNADEFNFDICNKHFIEKLDKLKEILEKYIHSQGFFCSSFYRIPETISRYPFETYRKAPKKKGTKDKKRHLPIVVLLRNLSDLRIVKHLTDGVNSANLDDMSGTLYDYGVYKNVLAYMEDYEMFCKNIKPEFLLTYRRYIIFKEQLIDTENICDDNILSEEEFNFLSKQNWLDLLLRIYKLFHYDRLLLEEPPKTGKLETPDFFKEEFKQYWTVNKECFLPQENNEAEIKLMLWVEFHFQAKKDKLWPDKKVPSREIRDLNKDLRDSLPLITLMATYCPYLEDSFKETYFEPFTDQGQLLHNACLVSEAWNKLGLSFTVATNNIVEPTNTEIIILLSYLYGILPYFYPTETMTIKSSLGETASVHIVLKNPGNVTTSYKAILFSNENESFRINESTIVLEGKQEKQITVCYTAKQIIKEEAVLVLSGETGTQKYSKSSAITIIGIPDILYFTNEYLLKVNMYDFTIKNTHVQSPYYKKYTANTYFYLYDADNPPLTLKDFVSVSSVPNLPRQFRIDGVCNFDEDGGLKLSINLCFVTCGIYTYYIYFVNKEIGVFCIKLTIESKLPDGVFEDVKIRMPSNFDTMTACRCKAGIKNALCPMMIKADIPFRNPHLLNGLRKMIGIHAEMDERDFWNTHLVFPKGFHIFRQYLENTFEEVLVPFKRVLDPEVTYLPKAGSDNYSTEGPIKIKDTTDEGTFQFQIHWDASSFPDEETLFFKADHGREIRRYHLKFWTREPRPLA